tara:strand:+ start:359 stop:733 length:375 start_codon:yes stop_codon:yes gene_type:complete
VHNQVRDFFIENLEVINEGLEFIEKELRIVGGDIDIVAKDKEAFYLIEVKTRLSKYKRSSKGPLRQLLKQKAGLRRIISIFTNEKLNLKLIIIEYVRDRSKVLVKYINSSGAIERTKDLNLKVD